ncbi:MAG: hypothetical protein JWQ38_2814 [Flavipsychrobacter sp.]|nr:hypothetical protein [Flavipsychrobacter sp.]
MKKTIIILYACAASLLLTQCAKKNSIGRNSTGKKAMTDRSAATNDKAEANTILTPEQTAHAHAVFTSKCADCHELKQPGRYTVKKWSKVLPDMSRKAKLSNDDAQLLKTWVMANAKAG